KPCRAWAVTRRRSPPGTGPWNSSSSVGVIGLGSAEPRAWPARAITPAPWPKPMRRLNPGRSHPANAPTAWPVCSPSPPPPLGPDPNRGAAARAARAEGLAARAVTLLSQAHAAWFFNDSNQVAILRKDADFDPLRARPDFQRLMLDLEFPTDPFAPGGLRP